MSLTLKAAACPGRAVPATAYKNAIAGYVLLIVAATGVWAVHGPMCAHTLAPPRLSAIVACIVFQALGNPPSGK